MLRLCLVALYTVLIGSFAYSVHQSAESGEHVAEIDGAAEPVATWCQYFRDVAAAHAQLASSFDRVKARQDIDDVGPMIIEQCDDVCGLFDAIATLPPLTAEQQQEVWTIFDRELDPALDQSLQRLIQSVRAAMTRVDDAESWAEVRDSFSRAAKRMEISGRQLKRFRDGRPSAGPTVAL